MLSQINESNLFQTCLCPILLPQTSGKLQWNRWDLHIIPCPPNTTHLIEARRKRILIRFNSSLLCAILSKAQKNHFRFKATEVSPCHWQKVLERFPDARHQNRTAWSAYPIQALLNC